MRRSSKTASHDHGMKGNCVGELRIPDFAEPRPPPRWKFAGLGSEKLLRAPNKMNPLLPEEGCLRMRAGWWEQAAPT